MTSLARGWLWNGLIDPGAMSMRASDTPRVLSPGIFGTLASVTTEPVGVLVTPGLAITSEWKSAAETFAALHGYPLIFISACFKIYMLVSNANKNIT